MGLSDIDDIVGSCLYTMKVQYCRGWRSVSGLAFCHQQQHSVREDIDNE